MCSKEQSSAQECVLDEAGEPVEQQTDAGDEVQMDESAMRISQLEAQLEQAAQREKDTALRARAEVDNIRRRAEQDIEKAHKFALEKFSSALLPVIDSLERALELTSKDDPAMLPTLEGIELTLKSLLDAVSKFGIEIVQDRNVPFNPDLHQAMTIIESADHASNHVIDIMQKGYTLNGRLLRPAMVVVSK